jgi:hypothetical protein
MTRLFALVNMKIKKQTVFILGAVIAVAVGAALFLMPRGKPAGSSLNGGSSSKTPATKDQNLWAGLFSGIFAKQGGSSTKAPPVTYGPEYRPDLMDPDALMAPSFS